MLDGVRQYACLGVGVLLVVGGTLATGLVPEGAVYQVVTGAVIVAGFALVFACLGAFEFLE